jgi:hypothetical protein
LTSDFSTASWLVNETSFSWNADSLNCPSFGELVPGPRLEQRDVPARAVRVEHEAVREVGGERVAVEAEARAAKLEAALEFLVAVRVLTGVGDVAELRLQRGLEEEVAVLAPDEEPFVVPGREGRHGAQRAAALGVAEHLRLRLRRRLLRIGRFQLRDACLEIGELLLQATARAWAP